MAPEEMVKYDKVTVHFTGETEPMVVEQVAEIAKSHFPGSGDPPLQIIDLSLDPTTGTVFSSRRSTLPIPPKLTTWCYRREKSVSSAEDLSGR
jgi:hypothetical protein